MCLAIPGTCIVIRWCALPTITDRASGLSRRTALYDPHAPSLTTAECRSTDLTPKLQSALSITIQK